MNMEQGRGTRPKTHSQFNQQPRSPGRQTSIPKLNKNVDQTHMLLSAVGNGNEVDVKSALKNGADHLKLIELIDGNNISLMHVAAFLGHENVLPHLLQAGLSVNGRDSKDRTPLMYAAMSGHTKTLKTLLSMGGDHQAYDSNGWTGLHFAAFKGHEQCIAALTPLITPTSHAISIIYKVTPLHIACRFGHKDIVNILANEGWSLTERNYHGNTSLHYAARCGSVAVVEYLVKRNVSPRIQNSSLLTPSNVAILHRKFDVGKWLDKYLHGDTIVIDEKDRMKMVIKCRKEQEKTHTRIVSWMMMRNAAGIISIPKHYDEHVLNKIGLTPLHVGAMRGSDCKTLRAMLERGVSPHVISPDNKTPQDLAQEHNNKKGLEELRRHNCEKNFSTPNTEHIKLLLSTINAGDDVQKVSRYICEGTPIDPMPGYPLSPLELAVINDRAKTVSLLLASGASLYPDLLKKAWHSQDTSPGVLASLLNAYCCRLEAEQRRLPQDDRRVICGIDNLIRSINSDSPWEATWPKTTHTELSSLLITVSQAKCPVTAAFLQKAGGWPFYSDHRGISALHAALDADHQDMAEVLIRDLGGSPYVPDTKRRLPIDLMEENFRTKINQIFFQKEKTALEDLERLQKSLEEKKMATKALGIHKMLFDNYTNKKLHKDSITDASSVMLLACRKGLNQLIYLLVKIGYISVGEVLNDTCGTTALHEAASYGQDSCVALLLSLGADPLLGDSYSQTSLLLAAMFGHTSTHDLLTQHTSLDPHCRANTTAANVTQNFAAYLATYEKPDHVLLMPTDRHNPERVTHKLLKSISLEYLKQDAQRLAVDFSKGETLEILNVLIEELNSIMNKVATIDSSCSGKINLVGSSQDGSKLYAPDEFDFNVVICKEDLKVNISERQDEAEIKGRLQISIDTDDFKSKLYETMYQILSQNKIQDKRLSIVPPGLTMRQVGVALSLAWQGQEFPLLLVGVDLVPVLEVPWHHLITKPFLFSSDISMQISKADDSSWRCSFAQAEARVLRSLDPTEHLLYLMGKLLLSRLKAEPWMPREKKTFCTWFALRNWKIATPSGFCYKNAFLMWLEKRRKRKEKEENIEEHMKVLADIFRQMCEDPKAKGDDLKPRRTSAYFGGEFEGRKLGEGAHIIIRYLEETLN